MIKELQKKILDSKKETNRLIEKIDDLLKKECSLDEKYLNNCFKVSSSKYLFFKKNGSTSIVSMIEVDKYEDEEIKIKQQFFDDIFDVDRCWSYLSDKYKISKKTFDKIINDFLIKLKIQTKEL